MAPKSDFSRGDRNPRAGNLHRHTAVQQGRRTHASQLSQAQRVQRGYAGHYIHSQPRGQLRALPQHDPYPNSYQTHLTFGHAGQSRATFGGAAYYNYPSPPSIYQQDLIYSNGGHPYYSSQYPSFYGSGVPYAQSPWAYPPTDPTLSQPPPSRSSSGPHHSMLANPYHKNYRYHADLERSRDFVFGYGQSAGFYHRFPAHAIEKSLGVSDTAWVWPSIASRRGHIFCENTPRSPPGNEDTASKAADMYRTR
ncbi:S-methyl-5-thioribose-1-phosphate isomerase [Apiospora arundinis]